MAIPREAQAERAALIRYLRAQVVDNPIKASEVHWNMQMERLVSDVVAGKHVKAVRNGKV